MDFKEQYIKEKGYSNFNKYNENDYTKFLEQKLAENKSENGDKSKPLLQIGFLTVSNLRKACDNYNYILVRNLHGDLLGINTKVSKIASKRKKYHGNQKTRFIGFMPCDFQTYISYKGGFV